MGYADLLTFLYNLRIKTKAIILSENNRIIQHIFSSDDPQLKESLKQLTRIKNEISKKMVTDHYDKESPEIVALNRQVTLLEKQLAKSASSDSSTSTVNFKVIQKELKPNDAAVEVIRVMNYKKDGPAGVLSASSSYLFLILKKKSSVPEYVVVKNGEQLRRHFPSSV